MTLRYLFVPFRATLNHTIKILLLSDFILYSGLGLIGPIFAIYIADRVEGGSIEAVGIATTVFLVTKAVVQIPVAKYVDKRTGEVDDFYIMLLGTALFVIVPISYLFATKVSHIYIAQVIHGLAGALSTPTYQAIYTRHLDKNSAGFEWSIFYSTNELSVAVTATIGAIVAQTWGFEILFYAVSALATLGTLSLILIKPDITKKLKST